MAPPQIPAGIASKLFDDISPLLSQLGVIQGNIQSLIISQVEDPAKTLSRWSVERRRIGEAYAELAIQQKAWAEKSVPKAYLQSLRDSARELREFEKITRHPHKTVMDIMNQKNTGVLTQLMENRITQPYSKGVEAGAKYAQKWVRELSDILIGGEKMGFKRGDLDFTMLQGLTSSGGDLRKVVSSLRLQFIQKGGKDVLQKKFMKVGGRSMRPDAYAELIARTRFHELQSQAALTQAVNFEAPFIKISDHNAPSDSCKPYEGKIFSISGDHGKKYPKLERLPPYHPNCRHTAHPQFLEEEVA